MNPLRWPGIRHIRWMIAVYRVNRWVQMWGALCMSQSDEETLAAIWRGEF